MPALRRAALAAAILLAPPAAFAEQPAAAPARAGALTVEAQAFETYNARRHDAEFGRLWVPENRTRRGSRLIQIAFVRLRSTARTSGICEAIGVPAGNPTLSPRPRGRMPVLFLSGGLDPNTPPFQAEYVRWGFPNSGHEMLPSRDVQSLVVDFFAGEDVAGRSIRFEPPRFLSLAEARALPAEGRR